MSVKNNITIDCRMINSSGIGTYIKNLVPLMINELDSNKYFLLKKPLAIGILPKVINGLILFPVILQII